MALNLSKAERERLEAGLNVAEPYAPDDPILTRLMPTSILTVTAPR